MLTGDRPETAVRVGAEMGISPSASACLTGRMMERMSLSDVARQAEHCSIFAKLLPSHKAVLIRLFQQKGHSVAMVGDGPNDGLALKAADVAVSFAENASPVASRLCQILITELPDVIKIIEAGKRIKIHAKHWNWCRVLMLIALVCLPYLWVASLTT